MRDTSYRIGAGRIALGYLVISVLWIMLSDRLLEAMVSDPESWLPIQTIKGMIFVVGSAVLIYFVVARSLSAATTSENRRRRREQRYQALIENMSDAVTVVRPDGTLSYLSPAFERITGFRREERLGRSAFEYVHPEDVESLKEKFRRLVAEPGARDTAMPRVRHKDGSWRTVRLVGQNLLENPAVKGIVVTHSDVTQHVRMEARLGETEERFRLMLEGSEQVFFYEHDTDGRFLYLSPSIRAVLGYEPEELVGRHYGDLLTQDESDAEVHRRTERAIGGDMDAQPYPALTRARNGQAVNLELVERPLFRDGQVVGVQGFARDVTASRAMEEQFRQAQKMEAVGRLAGGVAHDFNNILTAITGHVDMVLEDLREGDRLRSDIEEIGRSAERAAALTRQLLAFSRQQVLRPRVLDLNTVITDMERMLRRLIGEHIRLETDLDPTLSRIEADPMQVQQVMMNLVVNARDAMPQGGRLSITTGDVVLTEEDVRQWSYPVRPGPYVLLAVSDSGEGMDQETLDHIFDPFFTTKAAGKGTGLGLSTVYGIVKQSGGYIWADSRPGEGTTFRIYLPRTGVVEEPSSEGGDAEPDLVRPGGATGTILVVEDEDSVRDLVRRVLTRHGYLTLEAEDGDQALAIADAYEGPVDVVLTDMVMPGMGGSELGGLIRESRPEASILFMSGYTEDEVILDGVGRSGIDFLEKPFSPSDLLRAVQRVLGGRGGDGGRAAPGG